jgi:biotin carboxylase
MENALLIVGFRQDLIRACKELGLPFLLWTEREPRFHHPGALNFIHPYSSSKKHLSTSLKQIQHTLSEKIETVIPATEKSVVASSLIARKIGAKGIEPITAWRCTDKLLMKNYLSTKSVPMARYQPFKTNQSLKSLGDHLHWPIVAKFRNESGGKGVDIARSPTELEPLLARGRMFEQFLDCKECSIESLVVNGQIVFTNITEYYKKRHINILPANYDDDTTNQILALNQSVIDALEIKNGMTHLEMYLTEDGPYFGEIAHRPPGGYIMKLIELAYGFCPWRAYLSASMNQKPTVYQKPRCYAAAHVIYPGEGSIASLDLAAWKNLKTRAGIQRVKLKVSEGDILGRRISSGQDAGYVIQQDQSYDALIKEVNSIDAFITSAMSLQSVI